MSGRDCQEEKKKWVGVCLMHNFKSICNLKGAQGFQIPEESVLH